jgi:hypothetical protein
VLDVLLLLACLLARPGWLVYGLCLWWCWVLSWVPVGVVMV